MANRLANAISPYLRSHAENPVDWFEWGAEPFDEARRRDVPVLVSIGYSTCHWCHVMARESFSDPALAGYLNERFVAIKVDREEHPQVDSSYLSSASAFTENLGWPLNVFVTPGGRTFFAGTYFPPDAVSGLPSFRQVLGAVSEAWSQHRDEVETSAARVVEALAAASELAESGAELPDAAALDAAVALLARFEDAQFGGFGGAPKFPVAPVLGFLLKRPDGRELGLRTLRAMAASPLRDVVDGGFFRYATRRDWGDPHYERMLYDNALLLDDYTRAAILDGQRDDGWAAEAADGIARFLIRVLQLPSGGFASAQDSESVIEGVRVEGEYYARDPAERALLAPPALDQKVLTGWNGLAIAAMSRAGVALDRPAWLAAARRAADYLLSSHVHESGELVRASLDGRISAAPATLEDYGAFSEGLLELALATGESGYANAARDLVAATIEAGSAAGSAAGRAGEPFASPAGGDPVLTAQGLSVRVDPSEGAYPSGLTLVASAAELLYAMTAERAYDSAARAAMRLISAHATESPMAFGGALRLLADLAEAPTQLVVVEPSGVSAGLGAATTDPLVDVARRLGSGLVAVVTDVQAAELTASGFELFEGRTSREGRAAAHLCRDFVCALPTTDPRALRSLVIAAEG
jgi:uncharacterized protein